MTWIKENWLYVAIVAAICAGFAFLMSPSQANAADLGSDGYADLEERIAELEATTARKGNRKVSLTVYGQVNASLLSIDAGDLLDDTRVTQGAGDLNSSFIGFTGKAAISQDLSAGFVLEIDTQQYGALGALETSEIGTRQSFLYIRSATLGAVSLGKTSNATNNFDGITTANTSIVAQPLSVQPAGNVMVGGLDVPFDGTFRNVVRYDTPVMYGFAASASWGASGLDTDDETGNMWDVALRYSDEVQGFKLAGGLGYRVDDSQEFEVNIAGLALNIPTGIETETFLAAGSVMHIASGLFLTANYADQDWSGTGTILGNVDGNLEMWQLQGGLETKVFSVGKSTFYGEHGQFTLDFGGPLEGDVDLWGLGFVQAVDAAAMDLYVGWRQYDLGDLVNAGDEDKVDVINAGARIRF